MSEDIGPVVFEGDMSDAEIEDTYSLVDSAITGIGKEEVGPVFEYLM